MASCRWPHALLLVASIAYGSEGDVPDWQAGPAKFAVTPFENHVPNGRALDWIVAEAPFELAEKTEGGLGLGGAARAGPQERPARSRARGVPRSEAVRGAALDRRARSARERSEGRGARRRQVQLRERPRARRHSGAARGGARGGAGGQVGARAGPVPQARDAAAVGSRRALPARRRVVAARRRQGGRAPARAGD